MPNLFTEDEIVPVQIAQDLGYVTIGVHVDPGDWKQPTTAVMMPADIQPRSPIPIPIFAGNVHPPARFRRRPFSNGAVLPMMIDQLRAHGFQIVPVSQLAA